ncbi:MAG: stage II sporulation protein M [Clostridiales bacterium]|nr:stage II sporulation protein M [Clostridiales bacterium]
MKEVKFISKHSNTWKALEEMLHGQVKRADTLEAVAERMSLYRAACRHLSFAQTFYPGSSLCSYLARLTSEAHAAVYTHGQKRSIWGFFSRELPQNLRANASFVFAAAAIFILAGLISFVVSLLNPDIAAVFLPEQFRDYVPESSPDSAVAAIESWVSPLMSSAIMINNIYVSILALGLGLTCGLGTIYVLANNAFLLGALAAVYASNGGSLFFWSLILPHGVWELTAIIISGGIGLKIGYSLIRPGIFRRSDALLTAARSSVSLIALIVILLVVAGLIEGFFTPSEVDPLLKLVFAAASAIPLALYYNTNR